MNKVVTYNLNEDFIGNLADFVEENFLKKGSDISRLAFVFGGKRPALFLRRALAKKLSKSFFSPAFFSIDEFIQYTLLKRVNFVKMSDMESCYVIYALAKNIAPQIVKGRESFSQFLPWAREISKFIDLLDIGDVQSDLLENVQASASIGYEIPENINESLKNIVVLRDGYHKLLLEKNSFSRGFTYLSAANAVGEVDFEEFDKILFCGFFYMQKTERKIIKHLYDTDRAILFFQGDEDKWPVLKEVAREFSCSIKGQPKSDKAGGGEYPPNLYKAFDRHSQVCTVREILKKTENHNSTAIVLPDPNSMIPLVSEIGSSVGEFNVSLGYPLKRSSLHSLFEFIVRAQKTRKGTAYYAKDYISALSQPLVKNLRILPDYSSTRVLVHKIEEALLGMEDTSISGNLFVELKDVEGEAALFELTRETLMHMGIAANLVELKDVLRELHLLLFNLWEDISNFMDFSVSLGKFLDILIRKSLIANYPLNLKIANRIYSIRDELENAPFSGEDFSKEDIFKIFMNMLEDEIVAFSGSPLRGLQVIGMLETRCLNFENVIMMDANESKLPELRISEPLIPRDVIACLGLDTIEKEEEIQHYLFTRLISSARNVHLIYEENGEKEKSRFIEELIWKMQKREKNLDVTAVPKVSFSVKVLQVREGIRKTEEMIEFLKNFVYSSTSIDTYIHCPLRFYYRYVLRLDEKEELSEEPEGMEIGRFIHELLQQTFAKFINKKPILDEKFRKDFFKMFDEKFEYAFTKRMRSDSFLLKNIMQFRLNKFLDFEESSDERNVQEILLLEQKFNEILKFSDDTFNFTYIVDRVDKLGDGSLLILDYKTGAGTQKPGRIDSLEKLELKRESIRDRIKSFQLPLYYYFEKKKHAEEILNAALYSLRSPKLTYFPAKQKDLEKTMDVCMSALDFILHEIVNPDIEFAADHEQERYCKNCPFSCMCK